MTASVASLVFCAADAQTVDDLRSALESAGLSVPVRAPDHFLGRTGAGPIVLVDGGADVESALALCRRLGRSNGDGFAPVVLLTGHEAAGLRRRALEAGADLLVPRSLAPADFLAQVQALVRLKERQDQIGAKAAEAQRVHKRLQTTYQQIEIELDLARRLQQSFLPQSLPALPEVKFAVEYRPCGQVGGDFYDVFRLDEHHYGFYVADAMGHGVGASLLTIFVKKGVRAKDIVGQSYRLVPPDEVLTRLNHDFIEQALSDTPFITMVYGLLNFRDGILNFSRAGHPYPLYIPHDGPPQLWTMEGSLLGVFATHYRLRTQPLRPGDKVLFYTDGIDAAAFASHPVGSPSLLAAAEHFRDLPIEQFVQRLAIDLFGSTKQNDDLTLLGMEITA
jgi:sigma-B regulation protein RsbU (phosphoserine phosphatase)